MFFVLLARQLRTKELPRANEFLFCTTAQLLASTNKEHPGREWILVFVAIGAKCAISNEKASWRS